MTKPPLAGLAFVGSSSILRALAFQGDVTISAPNGATADKKWCEPPPDAKRWPVVVFNVYF
jgi:hypothetical protein